MEFFYGQRELRYTLSEAISSDNYSQTRHKTTHIITVIRRPTYHSARIDSIYRKFQKYKDQFYDRFNRSKGNRLLDKFKSNIQYPGRRWQWSVSFITTVAITTPLRATFLDRATWLTDVDNRV